MKYLLLLPFFLAFNHVYGQSDNKEERVFIKTAQTFGPDAKKLEKYLRANSIIPQSDFSGLPAGKHVMEIELVVDIHGKTGRYRATNNPPIALYERAVKLLRNYPGEWQPSSPCGRLVNSYWKYKLVFELL